jgi:hypothetical protein
LDNETVWKLFPKLEVLRKLTWFGSVITRCKGIYPRSILEYVPHVEKLYVHDDLAGKENEYGAIDFELYTLTAVVVLTRPDMKVAVSF